MKRVITILEGPDCSGKSTLAKDRMFRRVPVFHQGPFEKDPYVETFDLVGKAFFQDNHAEAVFDRLHLGEQVYGPIFRGVDKLGDEARDRIDQILRRSYDAVVVLCLPPLDVCTASWLDRKAKGGEMLNNVEQFIETYRAYQRLRTTLPVVTYDYTRHSLDELAFLIEEARREGP